jgi:hypothetical protein
MKEAIEAAPSRDLAIPTEIAVERSFYNRLIDIAADSFTGTRLEHLKDNLKLDIESANDEPYLIKILENFIEDRNFVAKVISEAQKIEYNKL